MDEHFHTWLGHQGPIEIRLFGFNVVLGVTNASLKTKLWMWISCVRVDRMSTTKFPMNLHWLMLWIGPIYTCRNWESQWIFLGTHSFIAICIVDYWTYIIEFFQMLTPKYCHVHLLFMVGHSYIVTTVCYYCVLLINHYLIHWDWCIEMDVQNEKTLFREKNWMWTYYL